MYMGWKTFPVMPRGSFHDLQSFIDSDTSFKVDEFYPQLGNLSNIKAFIWVPKDFATRVLYYNKDLFDKAGVAYPNDKWTWKDFVQQPKS
jgi:multiple sugar transport system substrate-binding protein